MTITAQYAIELQDKVSPTAESAASALVQLREKIDGDVRALRTMQQAMRNLQGGTSVNIQQFKALRDQIDAQKASIAAAQSQYLRLGGTFASLPPRVGGTERSFDRLLGATKKLPGPLGNVANGLEDMGDLVRGGGLLAAGIIAIAAAAALLVVGLVAAAGALARYAIASADARRSELLRIQALGGTAGAARDAQAAIDSVAESTAMPRANVERLASQLYRAGRRGADLEATLRRVTIRRLGGADVAARRLLSLDVQATKLKESFARLFGDLPIEGLLRAMKDVVDLFSQSTATGRALKVVIESIFGPMLTDVGRLSPLVKRFFQGMVISILLAAIAVLRLRNWFRETFGDSQLFANLDALDVAMKGGMLVMSLLAGVAITLAAALALVLIGVALLVLPFVLMGYAIYKGIEAIGELYDWITGIDWGTAGSSLIEGLVRGLESGRDWVVQTVRGIALDATAALTSALGIASPSRVFAELGRQIPRGLAVGIEAEASLADGAVEDLAQPRGRGAGGAPVSITFGDIVVQGVSGDARAIAADIVDELATALEGVGIDLGAQVT